MIKDIRKQPGKHTAGKHSSGSHSVGANSTEEQTGGSFPQEGSAAKLGVNPVRLSPAGQHSRQSSQSKPSIIRKGNFSLLTVGIVLLIGAVIGVAGFFGIRATQNYQSQNEARKKLDSVVTSIENIDKSIAKVDQVVNSKTTTSTAGDTAGERKLIEPSLKELDKQKSVVEAAAPNLRKDDKAFAKDIDAALDGRTNMLNTASDVLSIDTSASVALSHVDKGWTFALSGHQKNRDAVANSNKQTSEGFTAAVSQNNLAKADFDSALDEFAAVKKEFAEADLSAFTTYFNKRLEATTFAISADEANLDKKSTEANEAITKFNAVSQEVAELAKQLPKSPQEPIKIAYEKKLTQLLEAYKKAKVETANADKKVRASK